MEKERQEDKDKGRGREMLEVSREGEQNGTGTGGQGERGFIFVCRTGSRHASLEMPWNLCYLVGVLVSLPEHDLAFGIKP